VDRLVAVLPDEAAESLQVVEVLGRGVEREERRGGRRRVPDAVAEEDPATRREVTAHGIQRAARTAEDVRDTDRDHGLERSVLPRRGVGRDQRGPPTGRGAELRRVPRGVEVDADRGVRDGRHHRVVSVGDVADLMALHGAHRRPEGLPAQVRGPLALPWGASAGGPARRP
jgi:hypothetical protein